MAIMTSPSVVLEYLYMINFVVNCRLRYTIILVINQYVTYIRNCMCCLTIKMYINRC